MSRDEKSSGFKRTKVSIPLNPKVFAKCRKVKTWPSILTAIGLHVTVLGLAWLGSVPLGYWLAPLVIPLIAAIQMHFAILMHEGAHYLVHPNRRMNDWASDLLCALPLLTLVRHYRAVHLTHHQYSGQDLDPEHMIYADQGYAYAPLSRKRDLFVMLCKDISGLHAAKYAWSTIKFVRSQPKTPLVEPLELVFALGFYGIVLGLCWHFHLWLELAIFWLLPLFTVNFLFLKLHGYGEHTGATGPTEFERTYHHPQSWLFDFFVYPLRSGYHLQHHLYASVPWYQAARMQKELETHAVFREMAAPVRANFFGGDNPIFSRRLYLPK